MKATIKVLYALLRLFSRIVRPLTLGAQLLLIKDRSVLLIKHTYKSYWHLVGGGVERDETLEDAARREAFEEVGARLGNLHFFDAYTNLNENKNDHVIVFFCDDFTLSGKLNYEIESFRFFGLDNLPEDISAGSRRVIKKYLGVGSAVEDYDAFNPVIQKNDSY